MRYEVVLHGNTAVIGREGELVKGDPPDDAVFYSPEDTKLSGPPLPFERFDTTEEAEAWARAHATSVLFVKRD